MVAVIALSLGFVERFIGNHILAKMEPFHKRKGRYVSTYWKKI
jgi:hypothetical protein